MTDTHKIAPLDTDNWVSWSIQFVAKLELKDWAGALLQADHAHSSKVKALLALHVVERHLYVVDKAKTAKEAFDSLETTFKESSIARKLQLKKELADLEKGEAEDLNVYLSRARALENRLTAAGCSIDDLPLAFLGGLGEDYDMDVRIISAKGESIDLNAIMPQLLQTESLIKSRGAREERGASFNSTHQRPGQQQSRQRSGGRGAGQPQGRGRGQQPGVNPHRHLDCNYCKKKGHIERDCRKKQRDEAGTAGTSANPALMMATIGSAAIAVDSKCSNEWIIDTGASTHMTHDFSALLEYRSHKHATYIKCANGATARVEGTGDVTLNTTSGVVMLRDVLYVPELKANLLSVSSAMSKGTVGDFAADTITLRQSGRIVLTATRRSDLFFVDMLGAPAALASMQSSAQLWHRRFGHLGYGALSKMASGQLVQGLDVTPAAFLEAKQPPCGPCVMAKQHRRPFFPARSNASAPLERLHTDVCGPITPPTRAGERYVVTFTDEFTKLSVVQLIKTKNEVKTVLPEVIKLLETQSGLTVKGIRSDRGGEYLNEAVRSTLAQRGILHQTTAPYTPEQNGLAERINQTLMDRTRASLLDAELPRDMWGEALSTANYLRNRSLTANTPAGTPWQSFFGEPPDVSHLRVFGCTAYVHRPKQQRRKLDDKARKGVFVGYAPASKAYRVLVDNTIVTSRDVTFDEAVPVEDYFSDDGDDMPPLLEESDLDEDDEDDAAPGEPGPSEHVAGEQGTGELDLPPPAQPAPPAPQPPPAVQQPAAQQPPAQPPVPPSAHQPVPLQSANRPVRQRAAPDRFRPDAYHTAAHAIPLDDEPANEREALSGPAAAQWRHAMDEEMQSLAANQCWQLQELPPDAKAIGCKWVFKIKRDSKGNVERYKARLVAKGFTQREHIDFEEVYAPVSQYSTLRAFLAVIAEQDLELRQLDITTAFLNGDLTEELYMQQPPGYNFGGPRTACRLLRAIYGLRQAGRAWHIKLKAALLNIGFSPSTADASFFILQSGGDLILVLVYVDDILIAAPSMDAIAGIISQLLTVFKGRDLGEPVLFLGMQIRRDRQLRTLHLRQERYALSICDRFGPSGSRAKVLPLAPGLQLVREGDAMSVDEGLFGELIGCLLYLASCTRPDIAQAVGTLARFMSAPKQQHWHAAMGVLRYISNTSTMGITYSGSAPLQIFCDADFAGDIDTRRSRTGFVGTLNGGAIVWNSKLQPTVAVSTCEAEYMALAAACKDALWLRKLLPDLGMALGPQPITIRCDNQGALMLARNPISTPRSKHIDVLHHFARERAERSEVSFVHVGTADNIADSLTKALPEAKFKFCLEGMGVKE